MNITANDFRKVVHRVLYVIDRYKEHEKLRRSGTEAEQKEGYTQVYDYHDVEFPIESISENDFKIDVRFMRSFCGDTDYVSGFKITPEMIENPEQELARLFQQREVEARKALKRKNEKMKQDIIDRKEANEKADKEEYERLKKKFKHLEMS